MTCTKPRRILVHHHSDQVVETHFGLPAQFLPRPARVSEQVIHLRRAEQSRVRFNVIPVIHAQVAEGDFQKLAAGMGYSAGHTILSRGP